jgi:hypothetical protein
MTHSDELPRNDGADCSRQNESRITNLGLPNLRRGRRAAPPEVQVARAHALLDRPAATPVGAARGAALREPAVMCRQAVTCGGHYLDSAALAIRTSPVKLESPTYCQHDMGCVSGRNMSGALIA